jgi:hypothetical protein
MEACSSSSDRTSTCASEPVRADQIVGMPALGRSMHEATDIVADFAPVPFSIAYQNPDDALHSRHRTAMIPTSFYRS